MAELLFLIDRLEGGLVRAAGGTSALSKRILKRKAQVPSQKNYDERHQRRF